MDRICLFGGYMFYEFKHLGSSDYFLKECGEDFSFPPHMHLCFELIVILEGEMKVTVDGEEYFLQKGEALLIFPNQLHSLESERSRHMLCIFAPDLVRAYSYKTEKCLPESNKFCLDEYLIETFGKMNSDADNIAKKGFLYSVCASFDKTASYTTKKAGQKELLSSIFAFVESNYATDCSLEKLASAIGYDYAYLSRYFKRSTGVPYVTYLNVYRLNKACYLLDNTDNSILRCALDVGYNSLRTFNRNFKAQFGISPAEYRKKGIK